MKFVRLVFLLVATVSSQSLWASGTGDIGSGTNEVLVLECFNSITDVEIKIVGKKVVVEVSGVNDDVYKSTYEPSQAESFNPLKFDIFAFHKKIESHGTIGEGVSLKVQAGEGQLIKNGYLQQLTCREPLENN